FISAIAAVATIALVSAQPSCITCLQNSISALPLCQGLNITIGAMEPNSTPGLPACLCSSLDGSWIDACVNSNACGDISSFKQNYSQNIQDAGLYCGATPTFVPVSSSK
ncbi:hypothetical protein BGZ46_004773, partial [Entomortierella lignicola]